MRKIFVIQIREQYKQEIYIPTANRHGDFGDFNEEVQIPINAVSYYRLGAYNWTGDITDAAEFPSLEAAEDELSRITFPGYYYIQPYYVI